MNRFSIFYLIILFLISSHVFSQTKVACVGNSITFGYGIATEDTYPSQLGGLLGDNWVVTNYGISSRTMLKNGDRPYWNESIYTSAKSGKPDIVIILLGTNDAKLTLNWNPYSNEYVGDYIDMVNSFETLSCRPEVWVCTLVPAMQDIWDIHESTIKNEVNPKIEEVAVAKGLCLIDLHEVLTSTTEYIGDKIHPNAAGYALMATKINSFLSAQKPVFTQVSDTLIAPEANAYQWYYNGDTIPASESGQNQRIPITKEGKYKVSVKLKASSLDRLVSTEQNISNTSNIDISNSFESPQLIYPNPTNSNAFIHLEKAIESNIYIIDLAGKIVHKEKTSSNPIILNVENLPESTYLVKIENTNTTKIFKLVCTN